jgi:hypothetical protein
MSDAYTLVKCEDEKMKEFNERIAKACSENHVTDGQIDIVDGQPVVTLLFTDGEDIDPEEEGQDPMAVMVAKVSAVSGDSAALSEKFMGALYDEADASVVDVQFAVGPAFEWVTATDLLHISKAAYKFAEVVRHNQNFGAEFAENANLKGFKPVAGKGSDPQASYDDAALRQDTALIRYNTSFALVAYLIVDDDEGEEAEEENPDTSNEEADAQEPAAVGEE